MEIYEHYPLKGLSTFGIDVKAQRVLFLRGSTLDEPFRFMHDVDELLASDFRKHPYMILGEGSNVLFTRDYEGTIIKIGEAVFHGGSDERFKYLTVGARMLTDEVVRISVGYKYYGAENLSAIPGNIGAAVVQNVGAYGVEIKDLVDTVDAIDLHSGNRKSFSNEECAFGYRSSIFKQEPGRWLIWRVKLRFSMDFQPNLSYKALADELQRRGVATPSQQQMRDIITDLRWSKLPRPEEYGSVGSFFKNPVVSTEQYEALKAQHPDLVAFPNADSWKLAAGWLIDRAGWKGRTLGRAGVWPKQALVLYNTGGCTGKEIQTLANTIIADVRTQFGVILEPEAIIV